MSLVPAFWDTSSLIPMCVAEKSTQQASILALQFSLVVWWGTAVEAHGSIARIYRSGTIDAANHRLALYQLSKLEEAWQEIMPSEMLRDTAKVLLDQYPLRAADSLQLAAALIWCDNKSTNRTFITADIRLSEAASLAGFTVRTP